MSQLSLFLCSLEELWEDELTGQSPILSPACPRGGNMSGEVAICTLYRGGKLAFLAEGQGERNAIVT